MITNLDLATYETIDRPLKNVNVVGIKLASLAGNDSYRSYSKTRYRANSCQNFSGPQTMEDETVRELSGRRCKQGEDSNPGLRGPAAERLPNRPRHKKKGRDRQTDRETDIQTDSQRQTDRQTETESDREDGQEIMGCGRMMKLEGADLTKIMFQRIKDKAFTNMSKPSVNFEVVSETAQWKIESMLPHFDVKSACIHHTQSHYPDTGPTRLDTKSIMPDTMRISC
ncbi:hypothetical protein ElyMa_005734500 [Elysia marginata]|uniref:Uncharacterized protein n=1 Tax=Elysia marginata TaxID=1093978 RepID=A0AAV4FJS2_9GAST|nr:hypothetical protein ElyMa_005734500 [Elysia marginata]